MSIAVTVFAPLALFIATQNPSSPTPSSETSPTPSDIPATSSATDATPVDAPAIAPAAAPAVTATTSTAPAATPAASTINPADATMWSIGAGIDFSGTAAGGDLERRVSDALWLVLDVNGSFIQSNFTAEPVEIPFGAQTTSQTSNNASASLGAGVRWVLFTTEHVVFSTRAIARATVSTGDLTRQQSTYDATTDEFTESNQDEQSFGWAVGAVGGITVDFPFADVLALRFAAGLVDVSYDQTQTETRSGDDAPPVIDDEGALRAGLQFSPALQLRVFF